MSLATFLEEADVDLEDLYANGRCWTALRRACGVPLSAPRAEDSQFERAVSRMLHVDDAMRLDGIRALVRGPIPEANDKDPLQRFLYVLLGFVREPYTKMGEAWSMLWDDAAMRDEIDQLLALVADRSRRITCGLEGSLASLPLRVHATYSLDEILAGIDERTTKGGVKRIQTGVFYHQPLRVDLHFVTLEKSEKEYSPTTLYNDYAISPTRFHVETQSTCSPETPTGRRYMQCVRGADQHSLIFVRQRRRDARSETMPYLFLGEAFYSTHRGSKPMQIEWDLARPMPSGFFQETKVAAG